MLRIEHITKTFDKGTVNEHTALRDLNLHVKQGDFITIIGANGAGKSTLFNAIAGTFIADGGKIVLDGEDVTLQPAHVRARNIGRLFQDPMLGTAPGMTIEENLALAGGEGGWFSVMKARDRERFKNELARLEMGLEERMKQPVGLLSGGQRQALSLLMATINPPKILLLDEHTAALDPKAAEQVLALTNEIVEKNHLTCLMITHNMNSALELGNRTIMMHAGHIIYDVAGSDRAGVTVTDLHARFKEAAGEALDNDRMILT